MKKRQLAVCLLLATMCLAQAQQIGSKLHKPYAPATISANTPKWMEKLNDIENVNYYEMVDSFEHYLMLNPEARHKKGNTKPIVNHFRRWQKHYYPYVQRDGRIVPPSHEEFRNLVAEANKKAKQKPVTRAGADDRWKVISPMRTYDYRTKKMSPAQSNVQRFGVSRSNPQILYCGTETGMIFKTTDAGKNWTSPNPNHYFGGMVSAVDVSRNDPNKVVVTAGPFIWLTTNGGTDWKDITPAEFNKKHATVLNAIFHPENDNEILMGNAKGVYKTTDNGTGWSQICEGMCFDLKYKNGSSSTIYALVRRNWDINLAISKDGGNSFEYTLTDKSLSSGRIGLSEAPNGQDYIYVLACEATQYNSHMPPFYSGQPVLFKSTDGGQNWIKNDKLVKNSEFQPHDRNGGQGYYDMVITASSQNPEHLLFGIIFLYRSTDGGETFKMRGGYFGDHDLHCDMQDIYSSGNDTWLSTDGGIIHSNDFFDTNSEARINGLYASEMWGFDQGWNEDVMVGGRNHNGNMAQVDIYNGATISMLGSEVSTGYVFLSNPRNVTYSDLVRQVFHLPDNWETDAFDYTSYFEKYPYESTHYGIGLEYDPRYAKSFISILGSYHEDHKVIYKSVDEGMSYTQLPFTFPQPVTGYAISRSNPDKIVVITRTGGIFYSLDGGNTFQSYEGLPTELQDAYYGKVAIHPNNPNEIWITTGEPGGVWRTLNDGAEWQKMDTNLDLNLENNEKFLVNRFFLTGNEKNAVYAVGGIRRILNKDLDQTTLRTKVLYMDDTTDGWQDFSEGLPPVITINRMLPFYKEGKIRIATNNGIWERDLKDKNFKPIAQPIVLNAGKKEEGIAQLLMDSYSIVNQEGAKWEWSFSPEPVRIHDRTARQTVVEVADGVTYDVTLKVTAANGKSDTKTVRQMIQGGPNVAAGITGQEVLKHDITLASAVVAAGEDIVLSPRGINETCTWTLYNASGQSIQTLPVNATSNTTIKSDALAKGLYVYTINGKTFKKTGKLVVK